MVFSAQERSKCERGGLHVRQIDFFLWGYIKSKVYSTRPKNLEQLKVQINVAFQLVSNEKDGRFL